MTSETTAKSLYRPLALLCVVVCTTFLPGILVAWLISLSVRTHFGGIHVVSPTKWLLSMGVPIVFAFRGLAKKSLSLSGAIVALFVGFFMTVSSYCFSSSMMIFFITSSRLTKFRAEKKKTQEEEYKIGGARDWIQVLCNGGFPAAMSILYMLDFGCKETTINFQRHDANISSWLSVAVIGSVACACGDTWASEVGSVIGDGTSVLITTLKRVPAGTNGGITLAGTIASGLGGLVVGITYYATLLLMCTIDSPQWPLIVTAMFSGLFGSFVDSIFGATLQFSGIHEETRKVTSSPGPGVKRISGINLLSNHGVNFITCFITGCTAPFFHKVLEHFFT